jgi:hypothetical protein
VDGRSGRGCIKKRVSAGRDRFAGEKVQFVSGATPIVCRDLHPRYGRVLVCGRATRSGLGRAVRNTISLRRIIDPEKLRVLRRLLISSSGDGRPARFVGLLHWPKASPHTPPRLYILVLNFNCALANRISTALHYFGRLWFIVAPLGVRILIIVGRFRCTSSNRR